MNPDFDPSLPWHPAFQWLAFFAGLCVGSFLNVVIARVPAGESVVHPRSRCPKCGHMIQWYDNIPLVSWMLLRGRCRQCSVSIPVRYPMVELLVGLLALALVRYFGPDPRALIYFVFVAILVAVTYIDLDHWIIPHVLTWPGIAIGIGTSFINPDITPFDAAVGAGAGFGVFALLGVVGTAIFKKEALGQGDWWFLGLIGAFLGWKALLPVILLASLQGAAVGVLLILLGRSEPGENAEEAQSPSLAPAGAPAQALEAPTESAAPVETASSDEPAAVAETEQVSASGEEDEEDEDDWVPPKHAVPFGPFLALAALQQLFLGPSLFSAYERMIERLML